MATLRTAAMNLLRLAGFQSIRAGMQAMMHYMTTLLKMAKRKPQSGTGSNLEAAQQSQAGHVNPRVLSCLTHKGLTKNEIWRKVQ